jgi:hypothetical protein
MTINFDPTADFTNIADCTESVTLLRRGTTPGDPGEIIAHALRRSIAAGEFAAKNPDESRKYVNTDGNCIAADVDWHISSAELEDTPQIGDVIVDGDEHRWTILQIGTLMFGGRWKCTARELAIAYSLDDTVAILQAEYTKGDAGAIETTWKTYRTGIRARIQPLTVDVEVEHSAKETTASYRIFLEEDFELDHTYRIQNAEGTLFQITKTSGAARLGELQTVEAVKVF